MVTISVKVQNSLFNVPENLLPGDPRKSSDVFRRLEAERMSQSAWNLDTFLHFPKSEF